METKHLLAFFDDAAKAAALVSRPMQLIESDLLTSVAQVATSSWERAVTAWLYVPFGVTCILAICFGVHSLISLSSVAFPASVACMIGLFLILVLFQATLGDRKTKQILNLIDIPVGVAPLHSLSL